MHKTILVPLDGSRRAEAILRHIELSARCCQAKVIFMQVVEPVCVATGLPGTTVELSNDLTQQREDEAVAHLAGPARCVP